MTALTATYSTPGTKLALKDRLARIKAMRKFITEQFGDAPRGMIIGAARTYQHQEVVSLMRNLDGLQRDAEQRLARVSEPAPNRADRQELKRRAAIVAGRANDRWEHALHFIKKLAKEGDWRQVQVWATNACLAYENVAKEAGYA